MFYFDLIPALEGLSDKQRGRILYGLLCYARDGKQPNFEDDQILKALWPLMASRNDADAKRYEKQSQRNRYKAKFGRYREATKTAGKQPLSFYDWLISEGVDPESFDDLAD